MQSSQALTARNEYQFKALDKDDYDDLGIGTRPA